MGMECACKRFNKELRGCDPQYEAIRALRPELGFMHIPRTSGTALGKALGLGLWDPLLHKDFLGWHLPLSEENRTKRKHWFTIIRNPYQRVASEFKYAKHAAVLKKNKTQVRAMPNNVAELVDFTIPADNHFCLQYSIANGIKTWIRHENMQAELNEFMDSIGYPRIELPTNALWEKGVRLKEHILTEADKEIIYEKYKTDFEKLGYNK
jgi:hypothetical protein